MAEGTCEDGAGRWRVDGCVGVGGAGDGGELHKIFERGALFPNHCVSGGEGAGMCGVCVWGGEDRCVGRMGGWGYVPRLS